MSRRALGQSGWVPHSWSRSSTGRNSDPGSSCVPVPRVARAAVKSLALAARRELLWVAASFDRSKRNGDGANAGYVFASKAVIASVCRVLAVEDAAAVGVYHE